MAKVVNMKILVTGGAGFIGRSIVHKLLSSNYEVTVLDNLSNGSLQNIREFKDNPLFKFIEGDICEPQLVASAFKDIDLCIHAAAQVNVQESLDFPERAFTTNVQGTYNILEACRKKDAKLVLIGTCMVYDLTIAKPIRESDPIKPKSPYAGSKVAAEEMALSYFYGYKLPVAVVRPFNTYGPYQKSNMEGGVVNIFIKRYLDGEDMLVFGDGEQTRDLLFVEDCADFIVKAAFSEKAVGEVLNGGTGHDISMKNLALLICKDSNKIKFVPHHHPQSEVYKLLCDFSKAKKLLDWTPRISLEKGIDLTMNWFKNR
jgi:UDP-glucose 4-epimerase